MSSVVTVAERLLGTLKVFVLFSFSHFGDAEGATANISKMFITIIQSMQSKKMLMETEISRFQSAENWPS